MQAPDPLTPPLKKAKTGLSFAKLSLSRPKAPDRSRSSVDSEASSAGTSEGSCGILSSKGRFRKSSKGVLGGKAGGKEFEDMVHDVWASHTGSLRETRKQVQDQLAKEDRKDRFTINPRFSWWMP